MVYILQNLRQRQKTSDIDTLLVIQYKYYKIREVGGKIMYQKGQYIIYGIRGVCEVMDIITIDRPDGPKDRLYYVLRPYYQQDSKIVTPVDSEKTITRPLLSKEEALELIDKISDVKEMEMTNDKQREERYKEALKTCDCRVWISMIKALYLRRKDRLEQGKKMTDLDERYFKTAEDNLYSELALSLGMKKDEMVSYITERVLAEA